MHIAGGSGTNVTVNATAWAIRKCREKRNVSARQLSLAAGFSESYVSKIESGELAPSFSAFASIARELEMTPWELMFCVLFADSSMEANELITRGPDAS